MPIRHLIILLTLLFARPAVATPPDAVRVDGSVLCTASSSLVGLVQVITNQGTYYVTDARWQLMRFDAVTGAVEVSSLGGSIANTLNSEGPGDDPERSAVPGDAGAAGALERWGVRDCAVRPLAWWAGDLSPLELTWTFADDGVTLGLGERSRTIPLTASVDLRHLGDRASPDGDHAPTKFEAYELYEGSSRTLAAIYPAGDHAILWLEIEEELAVRPALLAVERNKLDANVSYLVNAAGLDRHREGRFEDAANWFRAALKADPSNTTAGFNLVCALARSDQPDLAMRQLEAMPPSDELTGKAKKDTDVDSLRGRKDFKAWLRSRP